MKTKLPEEYKQYGNSPVGKLAMTGNLKEIKNYIGDFPKSLQEVILYRIKHTKVRKHLSLPLTITERRLVGDIALRAKQGSHVRILDNENQEVEAIIKAIRVILLVEYKDNPHAISLSRVIGLI